MERHGLHKAVLPPAFDQAAAFPGKGRARLLRDPFPQGPRQATSFLRLGLDLTDQMAVRSIEMSISSPVTVRMRRISRPGWLSMVTMREPGARAKIDGGSAVGAFLPPDNFITAPTTSAIRARIIRLERIITAIFAAFSAGLFCGSGRSRTSNPLATVHSTERRRTSPSGPSSRPCPGRTPRRPLPRPHPAIARRRPRHPRGKDHKRRQPPGQRG